MKKIAIYCEANPNNSSFYDVSYELISKIYALKKTAKELMENDEFNYDIEAIFISDKFDESSITKAHKAGADKVILIKNDCFKTFSQTIFSKAFVDFCNTKEEKYDAIIFPATVHSRMIAPRITTMFETGLVADCTNIELILKENKLKLAPTRPTFGSELMATILSKKNPQCATIRPKTFKSEFNCKKEGIFEIYESASYDESRIKLINSTIEKEENKDYFKNAKIVFCAGLGLQGNNCEYYKKLSKLAEIFGARLASTRKVVDYGFLEPKTQIGQTGSTIEADLYITFGVSGAIQHICGMKNSKKIISINTDANAEIFKYSDYKIVADAKKIIDEMITKYIEI